MKWRQREMPVFCIEPHEALALDLPLDSVSLVEKRYLVLGWNVAMGFYWLCRVKHPQGAEFWLARSKWSKRAPLLKIPLHYHAAPHQVLAALEAGDFSRIVLFKGDSILRESESPSSEWRRLEMSRKLAEWVYPQTRERAAFCWKSSPTIGSFDGKTVGGSWRSSASEQEIESKVQEMLADSESDCAFAWRWVALNHDQRRHLKWRLANGDWQECEAVLRAILWVEWNMAQPLSCNLSIFGAVRSEIAKNEQIQKFYLNHTLVSFGDDQEEVVLSEEAKRRLRMAQSRFQWFLHPRWETRPLPGRDYSFGTTMLQFSVPAPSYHEQIEATVFLREWEAQHFPDSTSST